MQDGDPIVLPSAHRHGVREEDMLHALRHVLRSFALDDEMTIAIGPSTSGELLEVGTIRWYGQPAIAHAMPARPKFLKGR